MFGRKKDKRKLPGYFRKDQVGGLTHLLNMADRAGALGDIKAYRDALEERYGIDFASASIGGLLILLTPDKRKMAKIDELFPTNVARNELESQQLLSAFIYQACEPILNNPELAQMLITGARIRQRAISYMQVFIGECEALAQGWWDEIKSNATM